MAQELPLLESHIGSMDEAIILINDLCWNFRVTDTAVFAGDKLVFQGDSRDAVDAFLYGMALAYSVIPMEMFEALKAHFEGEE